MSEGTEDAFVIYLMAKGCEDELLQLLAQIDGAYLALFGTSATAGRVLLDARKHIEKQYHVIEGLKGKSDENNQD